MPKVRLGRISLELPRNRAVRITLGVVLILAGGLFGFLPILGYWMVPLGLLVLASDVPVIRRWNRRMTVAVVGWWKKRKPRGERNAVRRDAAKTDPASAPSNSR